jgi:hypothetical protein
MKISMCTSNWVAFREIKPNTLFQWSERVYLKIDSKDKTGVNLHDARITYFSEDDIVVQLESNTLIVHPVARVVD